MIEDKEGKEDKIVNLEKTEEITENQENQENIENPENIEITTEEMIMKEDQGKMMNQTDLRSNGLKSVLLNLESKV